MAETIRYPDETEDNGAVAYAETGTGYDPESPEQKALQEQVDAHFAEQGIPSDVNLDKLDAVADIAGYAKDMGRPDAAEGVAVEDASETSARTEQSDEITADTPEDTLEDDMEATEEEEAAAAAEAAGPAGIAPLEAHFAPTYMDPEMIDQLRALGADVGFATEGSSSMVDRVVYEPTGQPGDLERWHAIHDLLPEGALSPNVGLLPNTGAGEDSTS